MKVTVFQQFLYLNLFPPGPALYWQGINVITGTTIIGISETEEVKTIIYCVNNQQKKINAPNIVFATGRKGNTDSLDLSNAEIKAKWSV